MPGNSYTSPGAVLSDVPDTMIGMELTLKGQSITLENLIGKGTFAEVYSGRHRESDKLFALKFLSQKTAINKKVAEHEVTIIHLILADPNYCEHIPRIFYISMWNNLRCIVMEKMDADLLSYIVSTGGRPADVAFIRNVGRQILSGIDYIHSVGIIHTDIKPENIAIVDLRHSPLVVKIIDLGCALTFEVARKLTGSEIQSMFYRSPEILLGARFNEAIDIWSVGCLLAELYLGSPLYPGQIERQMIELIVSTQGFPDQLKDARHWNKYFTVRKIQTRGGQVIRTHRLKTNTEYLKSIGHSTAVEFEKIEHFGSLSNIVEYGLNYILDRQVTESDMLFSSLLHHLLDLAPLKRYSSEEALHDKFFRSGGQSDRMFVDRYSEGRIIKKAVRKSRSLVVL